MKKYAAGMLAGTLCAFALPAQAAPGLGQEIYSADVEQGELEGEARWGRLAGGEDGGKEALFLEIAYGVSQSLRFSISGEWEKEPGQTRDAEAVGFEALYAISEAGGFAFAVLGEYEVVFDGTDQMEAMLIMQRDSGPLDIRFNVIAEKELAGGEPVEFEYGVSADIAAFGEVRVGAEAFGELGTTKDFLPRAEHFAGPAAKFGIEGLGPELEVGVGYLFALGEAKDETDGMLRIGLDMEF
ncbi:hypothetical protein [Croceicoccus bisphenolivorans]|uniref:hypothetical protein n=1 Tax=Croceicoccus bisphenolivorans TaxID=1783232 RepID=UPI00083052D8|nr:hypothetical protein [Croceicoccus bisphenolivorans]